jgi:predicted O-linked N-acetylglucosamine transferase (SPINDLY family)
LRIGYFSADFRNHAMVHLAGRLFELHDRERFSIHAYALGPPSKDLARQRVRRAFDSFEEVDQFGDEEIAARARADGIDIAVDLMGYTEGSRIGIFAHRAAPVQVNFLGYPGTSGAPFMDYIVADPVVVGPAQRDSYSERLIRLPHTYLPADDQQTFPVGSQTRADAGLPDQGFVFCRFNNSYKIKPAEFSIWMRLLGEVDGSVLWLLASSPRMQANLRDAAARAGIDPARLVFAAAVPMPEHLARHRFADLFVDTFHYNAHTTASDALLTGLPLVTKAGSGFAARVAASLLHAAGLEELVAGSDDEYFELARDLAIDPVRVSEIRARLKANRQTMPFFDSAGFTRHIENGFEQAYQLFLDGKQPEDIIVAP